MANKINVLECGPRDGWQNLKQMLTFEQKLDLIDRLFDAGVTQMEVTSFVSPKAIPQMADAAELAKACIEKYPDATLYALAPNFRGVENAVNAGIKNISYVISVSESHNKANIRRTHEESLAELQKIMDTYPQANICVSLATVFGCPFEGVPTFSRLKFVLDQLSAMGIKVVGLGDTSGVATPLQVYNTTSRLLDAYPDINFFFHPHNTHGNAMANVFAAMQAGITHFDSSVAGLGGCPYAPGASGNIATEDLVDTMNEMGIETGIDVDRLLDTARFLREALGHSDSATLRAGKISDLSAEGPHHQCNR